MQFLQIGRADVACLLGGAWIVYYAVSRLVRRSGGAQTPLRGPPTTSWLWGVSKFLAASSNQAQIYEQWANQYGRVYRVPDVLGTSRVVLCDPKAVAQFYSKGTFTYVHTTLARIVIEAFVGSSCGPPPAAGSHFLIVWSWTSDCGRRKPSKVITIPHPGADIRLTNHCSGSARR